MQAEAKAPATPRRKIPYAEVIMTEKPLPPYLSGSGSIIRAIEFHQRHVTLRQSFYYESDGCYFKHTDEFFARPEIEEINRKLPSFCQINITENS